MTSARSRWGSRQQGLGVKHATMVGGRFVIDRQAALLMQPRGGQHVSMLKSSEMAAMREAAA